MSQTSYETLLVESADAVTTVTFNRPEKRNAMNPALHREMHEALTLIEADEATRVVVLTGAGSSFSSGMDLKEYFWDIGDDERQRRTNRRLVNEWSDRLLRMYAKPTIAMINGYCFGGAFAVIASCDIAVAADEAVFGLSEVNWGGLPAGMVSKAIATLMPYRQALYYAMTAEQFDGRRAAELGLVTESVPRAGLEQRVQQIAARLATLDADAVRATKEAFKQVVDLDYEQSYWWLMSKSDELRGRQKIAGKADQGIEGFLSKQYRPGDSSYTRPDRGDGG